MKILVSKFLFIITLSLFPLFGFSQGDDLADPEPYFSAFIVDNIEHSIDWYSTYLGFIVLNKKEFLESGFKQANLKRGDILIELIELEKAISPKETITDYNSKTRIQGIFKIGFLVSDFDQWVLHLTDLKVDFHGRVVSDEESGKKMVIIKDPDGNRIQLFEK